MTRRCSCCHRPLVCADRNHPGHMQRERELQRARRERFVWSAKVTLSMVTFIVVLGFLEGAFGR